MPKGNVSGGCNSGGCGCSTNKGMGCGCKGGCGISSKGCGKQDNKLHTFDWLAGVPGNENEDGYVEVQFKNTRKGYYKNSNRLPLEKGDIVAVESSPGHDIGTVTLTGRLVALQMKKAHVKPDAEVRRVYRKAKPVDMEKYEQAKAREHATMIRSRQIATHLQLQMKIGDVEFQGDGNRAIFYYIADERVDFRQLIKVLADEFKVRIEMKQIGARQEAGRIGGIGPCGRELCCATWLTNFVSVSTGAARLQDISLKPQKLAGQCAKLKCCMNYEVDTYAEAQKKLPSREIPLETKDNTYYCLKADILSGTLVYSTDKHLFVNAVTIDACRAFEVIQMNKQGEKPESLASNCKTTSSPVHSTDLLDQDSLTRFDRAKGGNKKRKQQSAQGGRNDRQQRSPRERGEQKERNYKNEPQRTQATAPNNEANGTQRGDAPNNRSAYRNRNNQRRSNRPRPQQGEQSQPSPTAE